MPKAKVDPFLRVVLWRRFDTITREMINALFRTGRSGIMNTGMDFSCSIVDRKFQAVSLEEGLPMQVAAVDLVPRAIVKKFGKDIKPGDCFMSNSVYYGNTHCADMTLIVPVFIKGKLSFFSIARAHLADMGFPTPTTYNPLAKDQYEEGLSLPCVRCQRDYQDMVDIIDICKANIRVPDQWYGDYLSQLGAVRAGEKRLIELCEKFGLETIENFSDEFQEYSARMAAEAMRKLPKGTWTKEGKYDSILPSLPNGIPVRLKITTYPDEGYVDVDVTDNIDNIPLGINMSEATVLGACREGVFYNLDPNIPHNTGAFSRVRVKMREGAMVGKPKPPAATGAATTDLGHLMGGLMQSTFADMGENMGIAMGNIGIPASCGVLSGPDFRRDGKPFVNQIVFGNFAGPALYGHDGWLTYFSAGSSGVLRHDSTELVELSHPVIIDKVEIRCDSGGAGQFDGTPGSEWICHARKDTLRLTYNAGGRDFPPQGVKGGCNGGAYDVWKVDASGKKSRLPIWGDVLLEPSTKIISNSTGGGGYGDPLDRDPDKVRWKAREGWISEEKARNVYGVVLDTSVEQYAVDWPETKKLREKLREQRAKKGGRTTR